MPMAQPTLDDVRRLIRAGTPWAWKKAGHLLWNRVAYPGKEQDAHFWMMLALTRSLQGRDATKWWELATKCPNYQQHMQGDWLRDEGLAALRAGRPNLAEWYFKEGKPFHKSTNRVAVLRMARGRLHYEKGEFEKAEKAFGEAWRLWESIPKSDPEQADSEWMDNCAFHWFKLRSQVGGDELPEGAREALESSARIRRIRVAFIRRLGKLGNQIDDYALVVAGTLW